VTGWLVPSAGQKIPVQPGWYLPPQKIRLVERVKSMYRRRVEPLALPSF